MDASPQCSLRQQKLEERCENPSQVVAPQWLCRVLPVFTAPLLVRAEDVSRLAALILVGALAAH